MHPDKREKNWTKSPREPSGVSPDTPSVFAASNHSQKQRLLFSHPEDGRASRHGPAMTDQPNHDSPEESPDPTHLHPVNGPDTTASDTPKDVPAEPGTSWETHDPGRKVTSPAAVNSMKWRGRTTGEGIQMRVDKAAVDKVWTLSTRPLSEQIRGERALCLPRRRQLSEEDPRRRFGLVMSSA